MVVPFTKKRSASYPKSLKVASEKQKVFHWIIFEFAIHTLITRFLDPAQGSYNAFPWLAQSVE